MEAIRTYRWFKRFSAIITPLFILVMLASQFPLSAHCYQMVMGDHHAKNKVCMTDGFCHTNSSGNQHYDCQCHKKHGDRPFFCSCDASGSALLSGLQLSKVLLPELPSANNELSPWFVPPGYLNPTSTPSAKEIFHPPQHS